jgi:nucleoside-diphosphate-sugar epimerase
MNFLLTGGTGFLGFNLALKILNMGNDVTIVSRQSENSKDRITKLSSLGARVVNSKQNAYLSELIHTDVRFDHVIHLAAHYSREHEPSEIRPMLDAAVVLGSEMMEISTLHNSKFYYAGSYLEYMTKDSIKPSLYVSSKIAYEQIVECYRKFEKIDITKIIFFDTYGKDDSRDKVLNSILSSKRDGTKLMLKAPNQLINLTYISDVVDGILRIIENPQKKLLRVSSDHFVKIIELHQRVNGLVTYEENSENLSFNLREQFPALEIPTPENWFPKISLTSGLELMQSNHD